MCGQTVVYSIVLSTATLDKSYNIWGPHSTRCYYTKVNQMKTLICFLLVDLVQVGLVQLYDVSHFASCMFWGFHSITSEQSGVVDGDPTSPVVSKECVASVRH